MKWRIGMKAFTITLIGIAILSSVINALAGNASFRCGNNLISLKDTMYEVRKSCGEPFSDQVIGEKTTYKVHKSKRHGIESAIYVTEWVYERKDGVYILTFEGSRLVAKEFIFGSSN